MLTYGLNTASQTVRSSLNKTNKVLSSTYERLSSGMRINKASDDAAGLTVADKLRTDARIFNQGRRNVNDGISAISIAESAISSLSSINTRLTELAEQAANGSFTLSQRVSLDKEAQALSREYTRIIQTTEFNGKKILLGGNGAFGISAGDGWQGMLNVGVGGATGTGSFVAGQTGVIFPLSGTYIIDIDGDGNNDVITSNKTTGLSIYTGNGDGSVSFSTTFGATAGSVSQTSIADFNGDGVLDFIRRDGGSPGSVIINYGNGDGTFGANTTVALSANSDQFVVGDFDGDGRADIAAFANNSDTLRIYNTEANGTMTLSQTISMGIGYTTGSVSLIDLNNNGYQDLVVSAGGNTHVFLGNGSGGFSTTATTSTGTGTFGDVDGNGNVDMVYRNGTNYYVAYGNGDGTFGAGNLVHTASSEFTGNLLLADLTGDGRLDIIQGDASFSNSRVLIQNSQGNFSGSDVNRYFLSFGDMNNDGVLDATGISLPLGDFGSISIGGTQVGASALQPFSLSSVASAKLALSQFSHKKDQLIKQLGQIGAYQSRLESANRVLESRYLNTKSAESRIRDADVAKEAADMVRLKILQDSAAALFAKANLQNEAAVKLLA